MVHVVVDVAVKIVQRFKIVKIGTTLRWVNNDIFRWTITLVTFTAKSSSLKQFAHFQTKIFHSVRCKKSTLGVANVQLLQNCISQRTIPTGYTLHYCRELKALMVGVLQILLAPIRHTAKRHLCFHGRRFYYWSGNDVWLPLLLDLHLSQDKLLQNSKYAILNLSHFILTKQHKEPELTKCTL